MKKLLLFIIVFGGAFLIAYQFGFVIGRSMKSGPPDFSVPETVAEYFFQAAMDGDQEKIRSVSADDSEETLLRAAASLRNAIPPESRDAGFRWQNTLAEDGEDQAYTGKVANIFFTIGLRRVGDEYQVCRLLSG